MKSQNVCSYQSLQNNYFTVQVVSLACKYTFSFFEKLWTFWSFENRTALCSYTSLKLHTNSFQHTGIATRVPVQWQRLWLMICKDLICCKEDVRQTTEELHTSASIWYHIWTLTLEILNAFSQSFYSGTFRNFSFAEIFCPWKITYLATAYNKISKHLCLHTMAVFPCHRYRSKHKIIKAFLNLLTSLFIPHAERLNDSQHFQTCNTEMWRIIISWIHSY